MSAPQRMISPMQDLPRRLTVFFPAYNASETLYAAMRSVVDGFAWGKGWTLETIVVDDGSADGAAIADICRAFENVRIVRHDTNLGMCAARNSGIAASTGDIVTLLDADDIFVPGWFDAFLDVMAQWPNEAHVCYTPCVNDRGQKTCLQPGFNGWLTAEDIVRGQKAGEYNPLFKGPYIRANPYVDLGMRKSCGLLTYLRMAREAPFWVADKVLRLYHDNVAGSVTCGWSRPDKAEESYRCFSAVLTTHGEFFAAVSPRDLTALRCKTLIYRVLAGKGRDLKGLGLAFSPHAPLIWLAAVVLTALGPRATAWIVTRARAWGFLRRYG